MVSRGVSVRPESGMRNRGRGLGLRPHHRRSLALSFSFRTDLITRVTDPTRGQWRQSRRSRRRRRRATWAQGWFCLPSFLLPVGWKSEHIEFHTRTDERAGSECGLEGRMTLDIPRLGVHLAIKSYSQMPVVEVSYPMILEMGEHLP